MKNYSNKKYILVFILSVFISVTALLGGSYALIQRVLVGRNTYSFKTGNFLVEFTNNNEITLSNSLPVYDNVGMNTGDEFVFSVVNNGNYISSYSIKIEDMSSDNLGDVIRYAVDYGNGYSYDNVYAYKDNKYIVQNKSLEIAGTDTYKLRFWLDIDTDESYIYKDGSIDTPKQFSAKVQISATQEEYKYASNILDSVYNQQNKEGLNAVNTSGTLHTTGEIREYRYSGSNVNNYVWFNCRNGYTSGSEYCEKWRIIGSFSNTYENGIGNYKMLKIVKDDALIQMKNYNNNDSYANFEGSSIQNYLNIDYYNTLSNNAKDLIIKAKWDIGTVLNTNNGITNYALEKNKLSYNYIGLINASDYGYASDNTLWNTLLNTNSFNGENNWLYEENNMIISTPNLEGTKIYYISTNGLSEGETTTNYSIRPVLYLKPDVSIINGLGTEDKPYELAIKYPMVYGKKTSIKAGEITYNLNGGIGVVESTYVGDEITSIVPSKDGYSFKGWSTNKDATVGEYKSGVIYTGQPTTLYAVWEEKVTLYDVIETKYADDFVQDDANMILVGTDEDINGNYVKYSDKLWRVVSINSDGMIKLVTNDSMTSKEWDVNGSIDYSQSSIRTWLNNDFLSTLDNYESYLVDSIWNYTAVASMTAKPNLTNYVTDKVGLIMSYEVYLVKGENVSNAAWLDGNYSWWTISAIDDPLYNEIAFLSFDSSEYGFVYSCEPTEQLGVRPSIVLKSGILVSDIDGDGSYGNGTIDSPYEIIAN